MAPNFWLESLRSRGLRLLPLGGKICAAAQGGENALITGAAPGGGKPRFVAAAFKGGGGDPLTWLTLKVLWNSRGKKRALN